jgi:hypothetical protein
MNDCSAKSKLPAPLIYLSKTGNYRYRSIIGGFETLEKRRIDLLIGSPEVQDSSDWTGNLRITPIRDPRHGQLA